MGEVGRGAGAIEHRNVLPLAVVRRARTGAGAAHPSQPGSADNAKGTTPQPASGATETGSGKPGAILDEVKVNAGNKGKIGEPSTVADKGAFIIGMLGFTPPSDNGVSGGIPGGHCEGTRCSSGAGPQTLWAVASLFGAKIVSKAQGMWSSVKAGALHASELAEKVADRAAERLSSAISRVTGKGAAREVVAAQGIRASTAGASEKIIHFGGGVRAGAATFHSRIKPEILKASGRFESRVGHNPDIRVVAGKIQLQGTGPFKGTTIKTDLNASDFFGVGE